MTVQHWIGGIIALVTLASFIFFAFRQGMKIRPSGKQDDGGIASSLTIGGEGIGGDSHGGGDAGHS